LEIILLVPDFDEVTVGFPMPVPGTSKVFGRPLPLENF